MGRRCSECKLSLQESSTTLATLGGFECAFWTLDTDTAQDKQNQQPQNEVHLMV
jgi:hypothetical protein